MNSMRREFLDTLHCPYSGSRFTVNTAVHESDSAINYAIAVSEAGDFPIVDGILRLKVDEYRSPLVDLIRNNKPAQALLIALEAPPYGMGRGINFLDRTVRTIGFHRIAEGLTALKRPMYRALTDTTRTLASTMKKLKSKSWANWQIYRFSMPHFLPVYSFLHLYEHGRVLDFGCGGGHAAFLISRRVPDSCITCADVLFQALYLARKFFVPNGNFVCVDGEYLLPFDSAYFSSVLSSDAMHFIDSKLSLSREFLRILSEDGTVILPHLHNKLSPLRRGRSLSPEGYRALFAGVETRIAAEDSVVDQFFGSDSLDLERRSAPEELQNAVNGLSLVASKDSTLFRRYCGLWKKHAECMLNPVANPIYQISGHHGQWHFKKQLGDSERAKLAPRSDTYLPETASVAAPSLDRQAILTLKMSKPTAFGELARQLVLIDVPERFQ